ncbi:MAG: ADOP family duplicated permease [Gemmatimonas sp.]
MNSPRNIPGRVRKLFRLPPSQEQIERELREEFDFHIEGRIEQVMHEGHSRSTAERIVREKFGDYHTHWQHTRRIDEDTMQQNRRFEFGTMLWSELQHSARTLLRTPAFTVIAVVTLALGIGATTSIFTVLDSIVLRPLPYPQAEQLVSVLHPATVTGSGDRKWGVSAGGYFQFRNRMSTLSEFGLYRTGSTTITNGGVADVARTATVTATVLNTLRARAELGRLFTADDDREGLPQLAILSHEYFMRRFGGDRSIIGKNLTTDYKPIQVIGVAQPGLTLPMPGPFASQSNLAGFGVDVWLPMQLNPSGPFYNTHPNVGIGRLRDGATIEEAQREFSSIMKSFTDSLPTVYSANFMKSYNFRVEVSALRNAVLGPNIPRALWMVLGSVVLVLLIASANVANLFLVRSEARRRESAIRAALGAGRAHLAMHYLAESLLLCLTAAVVGLALAVAGLRVLLHIAPTNIPRLTTIALGWSSIAVAFGIAAVHGIGLALLPLLRRLDISALREGGRGLSASPRQRTVRNGLVVGQVALALVLIAAAGLMMRSFVQLRNVKPGFDPSNITAFEVTLPFAEYDTYEKSYTFHRELMRLIGAIPGVESVGASGGTPFEDFGTGCGVIFHETPYIEGEKTPCVPLPSFMPGFAETLRIPVQGRVPGWTDFDQRLHTAIVTKALAERMWPGADPIGKRMNRNGPKADTWYTVVGVIPDIRLESLENPPTEAAFFASSGWQPNQRSDEANYPVYFVRTKTAPTPALMKRVNAVVSGLNPRVPVTNVREMSQVIERSMSRTSFITVLLGIAAAVALMLSAVGMYGVVSYLVAQRRNEIGIRIALGAGLSGVARLVVWQSVRLAIAGVAIGLAGAFAMGKLMTSLLFGVSAGDPATLVGVSALLLGVAAVASLAPARRAARIDPLEAMRPD